VLASVTIHYKALGDPRLLCLANLAGYADGADSALAKMTRLWSVCTFRQTDTPDVREIRACLGPRGEEHLVACGLGDDHTTDAELAPGVVRVRGCEGMIEWFGEQPAQQVKAGKRRAATARRDQRGRLLRGPSDVGDALPLESPLEALDSSGPAKHQPTPAQDPDPDPEICALSGDPDLGSDPAPSEAPPGDRSREHTAPGTVLALPLAPVPHKPVDLRVTPGPTRDREDLRRRLWNEAWTLAGLEHQKLKSEGVDSDARNCWSGMPDANSSEARALFARIDEHMLGDKPNVDAVREVFRNRILVAAAEARWNLKHLRFFTPARMWNAESFAIAKALSPAQVQASTQQRAGPKGARENAEPTRRIKTL